MEDQCPRKLELVLPIPMPGLVIMHQNRKIAGRGSCNSRVPKQSLPNKEAAMSESNSNCMPIITLQHSFGVRAVPVPGFPRYAVSDCGKVFSRKGMKEDSLLWECWSELAVWPKKSGHLLTRLGAGKNVQVHRLVAEAFLGPPPDGMECRHLDGNPKNNHITNLAWGTRSENNRDRCRHGKGNDGPNHCRAVFTEKQAATIIGLKKRHPRYKSGIEEFLVRWFGVSQPVVGRICRGESYVNCRSRD